MSLDDKDIERIAAALVDKVRATHHDFWIDPEIHYKQHLAMESLTPEVVKDLVAMVGDYKKAQSWFWKVFVTVLAAGVSVIAAAGLMFGFKTGGH